MRITARAKINWTLDVLGQRADGYHELDTVMQPLSLCDALDIAPADALTLSADGMAADERNLVLRAARALNRACGTAYGARIRLHKRIPIGAGLGGGSADAAATLRALNALWQLNLSREALADIAFSLGADVPFCLLDAPARARGVGERLSPLNAALACPLVLVQPCEGLLTKDVFSRYAPSGKALNVAGAAEALQNGDLQALAALAGNALAPAAYSLRPILLRAVADLSSNGALLAQMTGSGSAVFGAFDGAEAADRAYRALVDRYPVVLRAETAV